MSAPIESKPVTSKQALNVILLALDELKKHYVFDANMVEAGFVHSMNLSAYETCRRIETAKVFIRNLIILLDKANGYVGFSAISIDADPQDIRLHNKINVILKGLVK